jgi:hypothetical protein
MGELSQEVNFVDSFPYENWLHDQLNGASDRSVEQESPENWYRFAIQDANRPTIAPEWAAELVSLRSSPSSEA